MNKFDVRTNRSDYMTAISITAASDTHGVAPLPALLDGCESDVLIHCGDFTSGRTDRVYRDSCYVGHVRSFNRFCDELKEVRAQFREIVVVPGNHDQVCEAFPEECVYGGDSLPFMQVQICEI